MNIVNHTNITRLLIVSLGLMAQIACAGTVPPAPTATPTATVPAEQPQAPQQQLSLVQSKEKVKDAAHQLASDISDLDAAVNSIGSQGPRRRPKF